jgi:hypothetical protein
VGGRLEARLGEHADHPPVLREHGRREGAQADRARSRREVLEEEGGETAAVMGVVHEEGNLGFGPVPPAVVARHADEVVAALRHEGEPVRVVDGGEPLEVALGEARARAEVPEVDALGGLPFVERRQPAGVVGSYGSHLDGGPVGQHDIRLEGERIVARERGWAGGSLPVHAPKLPVASHLPTAG